MSESYRSNYKNKNSTENTNPENSTSENLTPNQARHIIYNYVPELDFPQVILGQLSEMHLNNS